MPYATSSQAEEYAGLSGFEYRDEVLLRTAARLVQKHAPAPVPEPADYAQKAADAEVMVFGYLNENTGGKASLSLSSVGSVGYVGHEAVLGIVKEAMGPYTRSGKVIVRNAQRG